MTLKRVEIALAIGVVIALAASVIRFSASCDDIRGNVLRLHILANSDSEQDQQLKLKVRDRLLEEGSYYLEYAQNEEDAENIIRPQLEKLREVAAEEIRQQGFSYDVRVELGEEYFGTRSYKDTTLPAGRYRALRVLIGSGEGKNWWCVMFPPMCLPAAEESSELDAVLTKDALEITQSDPQFEFRFKIVEWWESVFGKKAPSPEG